jgi:hypothetical protein
LILTKHFYHLKQTKSISPHEISGLTHLISIFSSQSIRVPLVACLPASLQRFSLADKPLVASCQWHPQSEKSFGNLYCEDYGEIEIQTTILYNDSDPDGLSLFLLHEIENTVERGVSRCKDYL